MSELRVTTLKHESATTDNITLDANGNVGIATTSPVEQLTIGGNGPQGRIGFNTTGVDHPYMQMTQYGSPNTNVTVRIDSEGNSYFNGGNVGIGTNSPSSKLHVVSSSGENKIISEATAASQQASMSLIVQAATPGQTVIYMGKTGAATNGQLGYDPNTNAMTMFTNNTERMRIDSAGRVTMPYQPAFHALRTSGTVAIDTVVLWNQVLLNRGNSYNASTGRFTAPITGAYLLHSHMNNTSGTGIHPELRINSANTNYYRGFGVGSTAHAGISAVVQMTAGDYADVYTGGYGAIQGDPGYNNAFCGYLIG